MRKFLLVLDALDNSPFEDKTLVVVTSDNGFHMGEKNRFNKNSLWELSAITPMAIEAPGSTKGGTVCPNPVKLIDLYPTFVEYTGSGISPLSKIGGINIFPLINNHEMQCMHPSLTFYGEGWVSVRNNRYRYIQYPDVTEELYDQFCDPWELNNIAGQRENKRIIFGSRKVVPNKMAEPLPGRWTSKIKELEVSMGKN